MVIWLNDNIITWNALAQLGVIFSILIVAYFFSAKSSLWLKRKVRNRKNQTVFKLHTSAKEMFFLIYTVILMWIAVVIAQGTNQPSNYIKDGRQPGHRLGGYPFNFQHDQKQILVPLHRLLRF